MSRLACILLGAAFVGLAAAPAGPAPRPAAEHGGVAVYFSPEGGAAEALIAVLGTAQRRISVEAFVFTHAGIADALIEAHQRGVAVDVVLDREQADIEGSQRRRLRRAGITIYIPQAETAKMHNKVVLIDDRTVLTGSLNLTWSADRTNFENLVVLRDQPPLAEAYARQHRRIQAASRRYGPPA